jgi:hypothetical protein
MNRQLVRQKRAEADIRTTAASKRQSVPRIVSHYPAGNRYTGWRRCTAQAPDFHPHGPAETILADSLTSR